MGNDGQLEGPNSLVPRDAYGFTLNYFTEDYKPVSNEVSPFTTVTTALPGDPATGLVAGNQLFNGNIASMFVNIGELGDAKLYGYRYDQLNRIKGMDAFNGFDDAANVINPVRIDDYHENINYDPNGNIKSYIRHGTTGNLPSGVTGGINMDSLEYEYISNTNKLKKVSDNTAYSGNYPNDIDNQTDDENYVYDAIGNLTRDNAEGISIDWNVYGKITHITKDDDTNIDYTYDAAGNRITKTVNGKTIYYVRDATGNVMSIYENDITSGDEMPLTQTEVHLYGSSRLGVYDVNVNVQDCAAEPDPVTTFMRGNKFFELSNHLGNVLATISDKRIGHNATDGTVDYFKAEVVTANDYYPGGMQMPGRKYSQPNGTYRYGFNGQEKSDEIKGEGNSYTAEYWEYDPRTGRRWNLDPVVKPYESPYATFGNNPIANIDPNGADTINFTRNTTIRKGGTMKSNLDNYPSKKIPDLVQTTGSIDIQSAKGLDVFRLIDNTTTIDEDGNSTSTSTTTTLDIRGTENMAYRNAGQNVKGFHNDRFALAAIAPASLLDYYTNKNKNFDWPTYIGTQDAKALKSDVPFAQTLQKITNYTYAITGAFAIARMTIVAALPASAGEASFFSGTSYTSKVFRQMNSDAFHGFPEGVKAFEKYGIRSTIKGGDGIERQMLRIPGQYGERNGFFEFIKEADGSINHRVFLPTK